MISVDFIVKHRLILLKLSIIIGTTVDLIIVIIQTRSQKTARIRVLLPLVLLVTARLVCKKVLEELVTKPLCEHLLSV